MKWAEISIHTTHEAVDAVTNALYEFDIKGVSLVDSLEVTREREQQFGEIYDLQVADYPEWGVVIQAYVPWNEQLNDLLCQLDQRIVFLKDLGIDIGAYEMTTRAVQEEDWAETWKQYYHSARVTERFTIVPSWETYERVSDDELIIELDPGMAFGTGTHPTTKLSLAMLEQYATKDDRIVDVGTGSGVLAIGAALLGVESIHAVDLDEVAVRSAKENVELNGLTGRIDVKQGDLLETVNDRPTLIVANILAEIIMSFSKEAYDLLPEGGYFLTSGIINKYEEDVIADFKEKGFDIVDILREGDWLGVVAQKVGNASCNATS